MTLENIKHDRCVISVKQKDVTTQLKPTVKLEKDNGECISVAENNITKKSCENGSVIFFIITELDLQTGYKYKFILEIEEKGEKHESKSFQLQGMSIILCPKLN